MQSQPSSRWLPALERGLAVLGEATANGSWHTALAAAAELQQLAGTRVRLDNADDIAALQHAQAALQGLARQVGEAREDAAAALREINTGRKAVRAYR